MLFEGFAMFMHILIIFFITVYIILHFLSRKSGFKPEEHDLNNLGPPLFTYRWGSVRIGLATYGRNVRITGYKDFIHLKLMRIFGGGEMLLPMQNAEFKFSRWIHGEVVDVIIDKKTYGFGRDMAKKIKEYYC